MLGLVSPADAKTLLVPEEHAAIQLAIDAASAGDIVLVNSGVYSERIRMKAGVVLRSAGEDQRGKVGLKRAEDTVIDGSGIESNDPGVLMAEDSTLDGFTVTGIGSYDEEKWKRHYATRGDDQEYEKIGQLGVAGVCVEKVNQCRVINNVVHHIGYTGILIVGDDQVGDDQVGDDQVAKRPHIIGNVSFRNMGGGIGVMHGASPTIESNLCFENFYAGIGHASNATPRVINNTCFGNIRAGIGISEGSQPVVRGNQCYDNRRAGIGVRTGEETAPLIEGNECFRNEMAGIGISDEATGIVRDNRCYRNKEAGIGCREGARPTIEGNQCYENNMAGIGIEKGASATLRNNQCRENRLAGIGVRENATAHLYQNRCEENQTVAIGVDSESNVTAISNHLIRTGGMPPMIAVKGSSTAWLIGNTIIGGGVAGVLAQGDVRVLGNEFIGNGPRKGPGPPHFAVWGHEDARVSMVNNQIRGWRHGLSTNKSFSVQAVGNEIRNFIDAAIVVKNSKRRTQILSNVAYSKGDQDRCVNIEGEGAISRENVVKIEESASEAGAK